MSEFKFNVTKLINATKHVVKVKANEKLDAFAKIRQMYPVSEYKCELID